MEKLKWWLFLLKHKKWDFFTLMDILFARQHIDICNKSSLHKRSKVLGLLWPQMKTVSSAYVSEEDDIGSERISFIKIWNIVGARTEPWGTPTLIGRVREELPFRDTNWRRPLRKEEMIWNDIQWILKLLSLLMRMSWLTQSNALLKSRKRPTTHLSLFLCAVMSFRILWTECVHEWPSWWMVRQTRAL